MKKNIFYFGNCFGALSCNKEHRLAMASADKDYILKVANKEFEKKKWTDALALRKTYNLVAGTDDAPEVLYKSAFAEYYDKNYKLAGYHFKRFCRKFSKDSRREETYMSALCYYEDSQDYNLDQANTNSAINELQDFINNYPSSERAKTSTK